MSPISQLLVSSAPNDGFDRLFHPDFSDTRVQDYLFRHIYAPGSTMDNPVLRDPNKLEYQFPQTLPTPIEIHVEKLIAPHLPIIARGVPQNWDFHAYMTHRACKDFVDRHQQFLKLLLCGDRKKGGFPGLLELKSKAVYQFLPDGGLAKQQDVAKQLQDLESEISRLTEEINQFYDWEDGIGKWVKIFRPKVYAAKEQEIKIKNNQTSEFRRKYSELTRPDKQVFVGGYGYWHFPRFLQVKAWFYTRIAENQKEAYRLREDARILETYSRHYVKETKRRYTGGLQPVYEHETKVLGKSLRDERTSSYDMVYEPGPLESMTDAQKRVAGELSNMPNFTARVKILNVDGLTLVEHTIHTLDPNQLPVKPIFGHTLTARIQRIQAKNRADGYMRERMKVEDEITKRQSQWGQHGQPPPPQQPRGRGSVSCPACKAQNALGAKFCNQCGHPI